MEAYNYPKLNKYILSLNRVYGIKRANDILAKAMNFQADNVRLVTWKDDDINAREGISHTKFVCFDKNCSSKEHRIVFLESINSKNIGRLGFVLSPYYQNSEGSLRHSIYHSLY